MKRLLFALLCALILPTAAFAQVKNVVGKNWLITPSFDGKLYSAWPAGDKPSGFVSAPTLITTDIVAGSTTGGENNKGAYVSLFGYALGLQSALGTTGGAKVYFQNPDTLAWCEVDNYRALNTSRTFTRLQTSRIIVQVGSLCGIAAGKVMSIKITVNGTDTNVLTSRFTVQPGNFYFASLSGNDGTGAVNNIALPFRYVQFYTGTTASGIWASGKLQAGDTIVIRGGTWSDNTGFDGRWVRFFQHTGNAPTGVAAHGYIHFVAYPGPVLGNAQEVVHFIDPSAGGGGIQGANTAPAAAGWGKYVSISGLWIQMNATSQSDAAPVNFQAGADNWRVVDNELGPWPSTTTGANDARCGGICGQGAGTPGPYVAMNYIHDIAGDPAQLQNHGIYIGDAGGSYNQMSANWTIEYNWILNSVGGSAIQWNDSIVSGTFTGFLVRNNYIDTAAKYGLNMANAVASATFYNNLVVGAGRNDMRFGENVTGQQIIVSHNTFRQLTSSSAYQQVVSNETSNLVSGSVKFAHNIIVTQSSNSMVYTGFGASDTAVTMTENLYYDISGVLAIPTKDSFGVSGNPLFTNQPTGDYTLATGSPGLGACTQAEPVAIAVDLYGIARPVTGTGAPGGTKNDIGISQGVGT